jgi:hypothetical protein
MSTLTRRDFISASAVAATGFAQTSSTLASDKELAGNNRNWSKIRGFNYHPSYAVNLIEIWDRFDSNTIATELARGKRYFPGINALRWWHSWDAFSRDPKAYVGKFEKVLQLSDAVGCVVTPVLFNRTHLPPLDFGSLYIDHFLPGSFLNQPGMFDEYFERLVGGFAEDRRILAWDLCNEPYWYNYKSSKPLDGRVLPVVPQAVVDAESEFLKFVYDRCKKLGAQAPLTVAAWGTGLVPLSMVNDISGVLSIHAYYNGNFSQVTKADFERQLDEDIAFAREVGKPLFVSECCWGNLDDAARVRDARYEIEQISRRGVGFLAYVMHYSRMPDAHGVDGGPVGFPGNLSFIGKDDSLRPGHEFFNEF